MGKYNTEICAIYWRIMSTGIPATIIRGDHSGEYDEWSVRVELARNQFAEIEPASEGWFDITVHDPQAGAWTPEVPVALGVNGDYTPALIAGLYLLADSPPPTPPADRWAKTCPDCKAEPGEECHWACSSNWPTSDDSVHPPPTAMRSGIAPTR